MPRTCLYVDETMATKGGYIPSAVTEGERGHSPLVGTGREASPWVFGPTLDDAKRQCEEYNAGLGITPDDALDIVLSSMAASR